MLSSRGFIAFLSLVPLWAGSVSGHAVITKRLTKKTVAPVVYNLRGASPASASREVEPLNEFDRMVVIPEFESILS